MMERREAKSSARPGEGFFGWVLVVVVVVGILWVW